MLKSVYANNFYHFNEQPQDLLISSLKKGREKCSIIKP